MAPKVVAVMTLDGGNTRRICESWGSFVKHALHKVNKSEDVAALEAINAFVAKTNLGVGNKRESDWCEQNKRETRIRDVQCVRYAKTIGNKRKCEQNKRETQ